MITGHLPELVILLVVGLIFFGPKRLPEMGEAIGTSIRNFKKGVAEKHEASEHQESPVVGDGATPVLVSPLSHVAESADPVPAVVESRS